MSSMVQSFAIPSKCATKSLQMKSSPNGGRKIVISSNWLVLFGFEAGTKVVEQSLGKSCGIVIKKACDVPDAPKKPKKVYKRTYRSRRNSPLETLMEVSKQSLINESFENTCERVHVYFENGKITIKPMTLHKDEALKNLTMDSHNKMFVACSAGVDISMMADNGFSCDFLLEYRRPEKRDAKRKSDLTETGALTALRNMPDIKCLFNEDISSVSTDMLKKTCAKNKFTTLLASLPCTEFSVVKAQSLKDASLDDLSSSMDLSYDALRVIEALKPPVAIFEQVHGWFRSEIFKMFDLRMRRWGYASNVLLANASDFGGHSLRPRGYAVFTCLPCEFSFEEPQGQTVKAWDLVRPHIGECRDVTKNKSIIDGKRNGRLRVFNKDSRYCPSQLKAQPRMASDSFVIEHDGKFLWPTEKIMKLIMGINDDFSLDCVSQDIGSEIIGQSVDAQFQNMVARSVKRHIDMYLQNCFGSKAEGVLNDLVASKDVDDVVNIRNPIQTSMF